MPAAGSLAATNYGFNFANGTLTVSATAPTILGINKSGTNFVISWSALNNASYRVQYTATFPGGTNWQNLVPDVTATNVTASAVDSTGAAAHRFYRVMVLP